MIKVIIADDHKVVAEGLYKILDSDPDIEVIGIAYDGTGVIEMLKEKETDIVLLDIDMPVMNGLDCAKAILKDYPMVKIAILTMHLDNGLIRKFIEIGVKGYMLKTIPWNELSIAIKMIAGGGEYFNAEVTRKLLVPESDTVNKININPLVLQLTPRELDIIRLICEGLSNTAIGNKLFISHKTVDKHRTNIMCKLNLHNVAALVRFAFQNGLAGEKIG